MSTIKEDIYSPRDYFTANTLKPIPQEKKREVKATLKKWDVVSKKIERKFSQVVTTPTQALIVPDTMNDKKTEQEQMDTAHNVVIIVVITICICVAVSFRINYYKNHELAITMCEPIKTRLLMCIKDMAGKLQGDDELRINVCEYIQEKWGNCEKSFMRRWL